MTDISYYLTLPYTTVLKRDDEGDVIATIQELDGCVTHGSNEAEALENIRTAQVAWLEHALAANQDIPVPELEEDLPSGKFVVRVPRSLHQKLIKLAKKDNVSLNQVMVLAATEHVTRRDTREETSRTVWHVAAWPETEAKWDKPSRTGVRREPKFLKMVRADGRIRSKEETRHR